MEQLLKLEWNPQSDITAYELALCMPYLLANRYWPSSEIDQNLTHFRNFTITEV